MSSITSPAIFKRLSCRIPSRVNSINPSKTPNSTCPLPQNNQRNKSKNSQYKVSHDITMLYKSFSELGPSKLPCTTAASPASPAAAAANPLPACLCCERTITSHACLPNQHQHETSHNRQTWALFHGSQHVKKYMKNIMTKKNLNDIISHGFPCPHTALANSKSNIQYYCEQCDHEQKQETIRLTLTPTHCRAQDNEIYNSNPDVSTVKQTKMKKRRGCIFFM